MYTCVYIYIYIYIYRERERDTGYSVRVCVCMAARGQSSEPRASRARRYGPTLAFIGTMYNSIVWYGMV